MWASLFAAWAEAPSPADWSALLVDDPAGAAFRLRDPAGPLASAFPEVRGSVAGAPVWVLDVTLDRDTARFDGVLAWTAPADVDHLVLRLPARELAGRVDRLKIAGHSFRWHGDLVSVKTSVAAGQTIALRISGQTTAPDDPDRFSRLLATDDALVLAGWLPLPTHCDAAGQWDEIPWNGRSDPGAHDAMVFLASVHTRWPAPVLLHPGEILQRTPGETVLAAIGVRELPLVALRDWQVVTREGEPLVRVWSRPDNEWSGSVAETVRRAVDDFTSRYGPLSSSRLDVVLALPSDRSGVELPGIVLLGSTRPTPGFGCLLVSHEVAHQWWYGEVGSDALREPWVDEGLATWSAVEHCRGMGEPMDDWSRWLDAGLVARQADRPAREYPSDQFLAVYVGPAEMLGDLVGEGLDSVLAAWLADHRWAFVEGSELVQLLIAARGRPAVDRAWALHMDRPERR